MGSSARRGMVRQGLPRRARVEPKCLRLADLGSRVLGRLIWIRVTRDGHATFRARCNWKIDRGFS